MTYVFKKQKAVALRRLGLSLGEIAKKVSVSKSTVSLWSRDVLLTRRQLRVLEQKMIQGRIAGRIKAAEFNHKKKIDTIKQYNEDGIQNVGKLTHKELLIAGIALYWGEGSKTDKLSFVNSDPSLIMFMYFWFQKVMNIEKQDFMPRVFINKSHKNRINKVIDYWSNLLQLPREQFGNPTLLKIKQKKIYPNHDQYYGMLALRIRNSTNLKYRILGLVEGLKCGI